MNWILRDNAHRRSLLKMLGAFKHQARDDANAHSDNSAGRDCRQDIRIDVTVATFNSADTVERSLDAIHASIPVRRLIVVDGGSTDKTVEIAERYARVVREPGPLGKVRYVQAENCSTEWIAYVDSDVYLYSSWWPNVRRFAVRPEVGMVLGLSDAPVSTLPLYESYLKHNARKYGLVAFSNTLIRRELVLKCTELLERVHAGEDSVVAAHIRKKGLKIVTIPVALCYHDRDPVRSHPSAYYRWGQSIRFRWGISGLKGVAKMLRDNIRNWYRFSIEAHVLSLTLLSYLFKLWLWAVVGFLSSFQRQCTHMRTFEACF